MATGPRIGKNGQLSKIVSFRLPPVLYAALCKMAQADKVEKVNIKARDGVIDKLYKGGFITKAQWQEMKSTE